MARKLRVEYPGALYHVMNRGDRREPIFKDDFDHRRFLATLGETCTKTGWQVHAYCLMGNHFQSERDTPTNAAAVPTKFALALGQVGFPSPANGFPNLDIRFAKCGLGYEPSESSPTSH